MPSRFFSESLLQELVEHVAKSTPKPLRPSEPSPKNIPTPPALPAQSLDPTAAKSKEDDVSRKEAADIKPQLAL